MKIIHLVTATAIVLTGPALVSDQFSFSADAAYAAGNGKGHGNTGSRGKSGNKAGGKSASKGGKSGATGLGKGASGDVKLAKAGPKSDAEPREKNVHAQLKSLNSLNRNINGLMNSSDPKMAGFRAFVVAGALAASTQKELDAQLEAYGIKAGEFEDAADALGISSDPEQALIDIADAREELGDAPAAGEDGYDDWVAASKSLDDAETAANGLIADSGEIEKTEEKLAGYQEASSEEAMTAAMVEGLNATGQNVTEDDMTDEMKAWVADKLGVDESDGLIDDYATKMEAEAASAEPAAGEEEQAALETEETNG